MTVGVGRQSLPRGLMLGGTWLRVRTRRRATELTRALAAGVDPIQSDELSLRAGQLRSQRSRESVADSIRGAVRLAELPTLNVGFDPLVRRSAVRRCAPLLLELADRLTADELLGVRGLARAWLLVRDGGSAMFRGGDRSLAYEVRSALATLEPHEGGSVTDRPDRS